jgi:hypothetical protein
LRLCAGGRRTRLTGDLLPGLGPGSRYEFGDEMVTPGVSYWYRLEAVDVHDTATLHGPVPAGAPVDASYRVYLPLVLR